MSKLWGSPQSLGTLSKKWRWQRGGALLATTEHLCSQRSLIARKYSNYEYKKRASVFKLKLFVKVAMTYSPTNICSTIGAVGLNFSVRDGKRWIPDAIDRLNF